MQVIITGGSGFIGTHLVDRLLSRGLPVRILDRRVGRALRAPIEIGDVTDFEAVSAVFRGGDIIYHLAAEHRDDVQPVSRYDEVNVRGARNVVAAAERQRIQRIVFVSSAAVYGERRSISYEWSEPAALSPYGESKRRAEKIFMRWARAAPGRSLLIVRPCAVFGEGGGGNIQNLIRQIARRRFLVVGSGRNRKSICYVANLADYLAAARPDPGHTIVNFADKPDLTVGELVERIRAELGLGSGIGPGVPYALGLAAGYCADATARILGTKRVLGADRVRKFCAETRIATHRLQRSGFEPRFTLEQGLKRTVQHFLAQDARQRSARDLSIGLGQVEPERLAT